MNIKERGIAIRAVLLENFQRSGKAQGPRLPFLDSSLCIITLGGAYNIINALGGCIYFLVQICNYVQYRSTITRSFYFLAFRFRIKSSHRAERTLCPSMPFGLLAGSGRSIWVVYCRGRLHLSIRVPPWSANFKWGNRKTALSSILFCASS
jgi:hypothetical protein